MTRFFRVALLVSLMVFVATVIGVSAYLERQGIRQPDDSLNLTTVAPTSTPQPTRTTEPGYTTTPAPAFEVTAQYLEALAAANKREQDASHTQIAAAYTAAANEATTTAVYQAVRGTDVAYDGALNDVNTKKTQNANAIEMEETLQAGILYKNEQITASEIRAAQKIDEWNALIQVGWLTLWRGLVLVGMVVIIALVAAYVARRNNYEAEWMEVTERHREEIERMEALAMDRTAAHAARISKLSRFVADAVAVVGRDDHQVPPNNRMDNWHAPQWQEVVDMLKADGAVETIRGGAAAGTYIKRPYTDLGGLLDAIESGQYPAERGE